MPKNLTPKQRTIARLAAELWKKQAAPRKRKHIPTVAELYDDLDRSMRAAEQAQAKRAK